MSSWVKWRDLPNQWSSTGDISNVWRQLWLSQLGVGVLLVCSRLRPRILLKILEYTGHTSHSTEHQCAKTKKPWSEWTQSSPAALSSKLVRSRCWDTGRSHAWERTKARTQLGNVGPSYLESDLTKSLPVLQELWKRDYPLEESYLGWKGRGPRILGPRAFLSSFLGATVRTADASYYWPAWSLAGVWPEKSVTLTSKWRPILKEGAPEGFWLTSLPAAGQWVLSCRPGLPLPQELKGSKWVFSTFKSDNNSKGS